MSNEMWKLGKLNLRKIDCASHDSKGVYCLQYDDEKIVSGLRDNTIKVCMGLDCDLCHTVTPPLSGSIVIEVL